jgi:hypothetical protein
LQTQVLPPGGLDVDGRPLRDDADDPAHGIRIRDDVEPPDERSARVGRRERREDLDRRRLAGAVRPEQREDAPRRDRERQSVECSHPLRVFLDEADRLDCLFHTRDLRARIRLVSKYLSN